jgi:hypothetical protein
MGSSNKKVLGGSLDSRGFDASIIGLPIKLKRHLSLDKGNYIALIMKNVR